jgi:hypothetical protein
MAPERSASEASTARTPAVSDELARYRSGSLALEEYLDTRADQAVAHLQDIASSEQIETIRGVIREQLTTRPDLVELLKRAGVELPPPAPAP